MTTSRDKIVRSYEMSTLQDVYTWHALAGSRIACKLLDSVVTKVSTEASVPELVNIMFKNVTLYPRELLSK